MLEPVVAFIDNLLTKKRCDWLTVKWLREKMRA